MFRKSKKRPPSRTLRMSNDDDEGEQDDDDLVGSALLAADRKGKRTIVTTNKKKKVRSSSSGGLGFGGGNVLTEVERVGEEEEEEDDGADPLEASLYDPIALSQLRSEQNQYAEIQAAWANNEPTKDMMRDTQDDDFVPLDKDAKDQEATTILTGEDAMLLEKQLEESEHGETAGATGSYANQLDSSYVQLRNSGKASRPPVLTEDDEWEARVAQRAGVGIRGQGGEPHNYPVSSGRAVPVSDQEGHHVLNQLYSKVDSTLAHLNKQQTDLRRVQGQREAEINGTRNNMEKQEQDLQQAGHAVEFYQELRMKLANWVGGLRQLQSKVQPIQEALHLLEGEVSSCHRRREWEKDMIAVLFQHNLLEQVLGRQPDSSVYEPLTARTVDEFGRDIQSLYSMQREKRRKRRQAIQQQRSDKVRGDESDAFLLEEEKETFRERRKALQDALELALEGLDEDYTNLQNLVNLFEDWKRQYGDDYKQCHATLSLADLATPLIQAELCSLNDPWNESGGYNESKWVAVIYSALESGVIDNEGVERIIEKAVIPSLTDLLDKSGFEVVSFRQNKSITEFWDHLKRVLPNADSPALLKVRHAMTRYIRRNLEDMAIAIIKQSASLDEPDCDELRDALNDAIVGQMHRIKKVLLNIMSCWAPILGRDSEFVETILSFVSYKFLSLLSSLQGFPQPRFEGTPIDVFQQVYKALEPTGWLDSAALLSLTIPIRAAATSYSKLEVSVN